MDVAGLAFISDASPPPEGAGDVIPRFLLPGLLPRPGLLSGVVVVVSVLNGLAFGAAATAAALAARKIARAR